MLSAANAEIKQQESFEELLAKDYRLRMIKLSQQDFHVVAIHDPEMDDGPSKYWVIREYDYHKIKREDYEKCKELMKEVDDYVFSVDDIGASARMDAMLTAYQYMAECFLKMKPEEFREADWEQVKDILNACIYRTENSVVAESKNLTELFFFGVAKKLTKPEHEAFQIYRLWKKWHTKPWEINGGIVYPEDINSTLRMEEIQMAAEKREREKDEARARLAKAGHRSARR